MAQIAQPPPDRPTNRTLRLTFEYEGSNVKLVSSQRVDMIIPPTQALTGHEDQTGFWFTLSDSQGKAVYRRTIQQPVKIDREVFSNDPKHPSIQRVPVEKPKGTFVVLVPDIPEARTVQLYSHPLNMESHGQPAREFARFDLSSAQIQEAKKP